MNRKNRIAIALILIVCLLTNVKILNANTELPIVESNMKSLEPAAVAQCGKYATHDMYSMGLGRLENSTTGKVVFVGGGCFQCTRCYLVCVTESDSVPYTSVGYYALKDYDEKISTNGVWLSVPTSMIYYTNGKTIPGLSFRYYKS